MYKFTKFAIVCVFLVSQSILVVYAQATLDPFIIVASVISDSDSGGGGFGGGGGGGGGGITIKSDPLRTAQENICAATQQVYTALKCNEKASSAPTDQVDLGTTQFSQGDLFLPIVLSYAQDLYNATSSAGLTSKRGIAFGASVAACGGIGICIAQVQVYFGANTVALPQSMWGDINAMANQYLRFMGTNTPITSSPVGKLTSKYYGSQACQKLKQAGTNDGCTPQ